MVVNNNCNNKNLHSASLWSISKRCIIMNNLLYGHIHKNHPSPKWQTWLHVNEWPAIPIHTDMCDHTGKEPHWSVILITRFTRISPWMYFSFNVFLLECMHIFNDSLDTTVGSHWQQIVISFIKRLDLKIVLPHRCQILRYMNTIPTPLSSIIIGSDHVVGNHNVFIKISKWLDLSRFLLMWWTYTTSRKSILVII